MAGVFLQSPWKIQESSGDLDADGEDDEQIHFRIFLIWLDSPPARGRNR